MLTQMVICTPTALGLASLLLLSSPAIAAIVAPNCDSVSWGWSSNSLNQSACVVAAYLMSICYGGSYSIGPLQQGYSYAGPESPSESDPCKCSSVVYSLISACDACQGAQWITWSKYSYNCTITSPPTLALGFPYPVPVGTRVPQWALIDVTLEGNWNASKSQAIGDSPEIVPGTVIGRPNSSSTSGAGGASAVRTSPATTSSPEPSQSGSSLNVGAIAGGIVGGIAVISIPATIIFYLSSGRSSRGSQH